MRPPYYIGLDAGGTKSLLAIEFIENGEIVTLTGGPLNICSISEETAALTAADLFQRAAAASSGPSSCEASLGAFSGKAISGAASSCAGIGIGAAGFTNPRAREFFLRETEKWFPGVPVRVGSDAMAALYGAHGDREGMILISGTGSVCYGERAVTGGPQESGSDERPGLCGGRGRMHAQAGGGGRDRICAQAGGGGHVIDDGGSGYAIGRDILAAVLRGMDGRQKQTALAELLREETGISTREELVAFVTDAETGKREIAALAPLITEAVGRGDAAATAIVSRAAGELFEMAAAVVEKLGFDGVADGADLARGAAGTADSRVGEPAPKLAFSGSVLLREPFLRAEVTKRLAAAFPDMEIYDAKGDAARGALLMAREAAEN